MCQRQRYKPYSSSGAPRASYRLASCLEAASVAVSHNCRLVGAAVVPGVSYRVASCLEASSVVLSHDRRYDAAFVVVSHNCRAVGADTHPVELQLSVVNESF